MSPADDDIQAQHYATMNDIAHMLDRAFKGYGFMLMVFDLNAAPGYGHMNYISNAERIDMCAAMREFIARSEQEKGML